MPAQSLCSCGMWLEALYKWYIPSPLPLSSLLLSDNLATLCVYQQGCYVSVCGEQSLSSLFEFPGHVAPRSGNNTGHPCSPSHRSGESQ